MVSGEADKELSSDNRNNFIAIESMTPNALILRGKFEVCYDQNSISAQGAQVLKRIILVVTRSGNYQALAPFEETVVFDDDVKERKGGCSGQFNIKIMDHIDFGGEGDYYILCSFGTLLSNIVKITV